MSDLKAMVGDLIRETRKAKGITQAELSEKLGISKGSFNRYENGNANLSLDTVKKVAEGLGVKVKIIFE